MISCTTLSQHICSTSQATEAASRETQSEMSSADSDWSDIRSISLKLGVLNPDELDTEVFKVDRQKLLTMIKTNTSLEGVNNAECFFENIMKITGTYVNWPSRLKIGAKSKKDPHVRIIGKPDKVSRAKELILADLESRGSRVIIKMDVSYTDHSFIIGRRGNNIKRIMESTTTHIHFPDSNLSNLSEKSNLVSLWGSLEDVERARSMVRLSMPLVISFELPIMAAGQPDHNTPYVGMIEEKFNVQVIFSSRPKLHSSLVLVKGSEKEVVQVQEAAKMLINFTCEDIAGQIQVYMQLEISPQYHEIIKGVNNNNLLDIMERTKTKIIFPDITDLNVKTVKKSQVTIIGSIDGVYKARQQIIGNLPVVLIFDFPYNQNNTSDIVSLNKKYGVYISLRQKQRQSSSNIVIKGLEKFIDKIYEARHEVLGLTSPLIKPEIPSNYFTPKDHNIDRFQLSQLLIRFCSDNMNWLKSPLPMVPLFNNGFHNLTNKDINRNINSKNDNDSPNGLTTNNNFSNCHSDIPNIGVFAPTQKFMEAHNNNFNRINNFVQPLRSTLPPPPPPPPPGMQMLMPSSGPNVSSRNSCHNTSGYQSFSSSTTSLENPSLGAYSGNSRGQYSPDSTCSTEAGGRVWRRSSDGILFGIGAAAGETDRFCCDANGVKKNRGFDFGLDMKRVMGLRAMERAPNSGEIRTPNTNWIGLSLSRTSPAHIEAVDSDASWNRIGNGNSNGAVSPISLYNLGITTSVMDSTPENRRSNLKQHKDIHSLLTILGLEHYIKIFVLNEIDLELFKTLTEKNLIELGITSFGARKKLLVAINILQTNEVLNEAMTPSFSLNGSPHFSGSAAPGAERRASNA